MQEPILDYRRCIFPKKFPSAFIIAIEAEKENYSMLCSNTKNYDTIKPVHAGLWPTQALLEIKNADSAATGFMVEETSIENPLSFRAITVNDVMKTYNIPYIDILKIDIEGAEKELLSENNGWINKCKIIILELHDRKKKGCSHAFFNAFSRYNFECHPFEQNFLLINNDLM